MGNIIRNKNPNVITQASKFSFFFFFDSFLFFFFFFSFFCILFFLYSSTTDAKTNLIFFFVNKEFRWQMRWTNQEQEQSTKEQYEPNSKDTTNTRNQKWNERNCKDKTWSRAKALIPNDTETSLNKRENPLAIRTPNTLTRKPQHQFGFNP